MENEKLKDLAEKMLKLIEIIYLLDAKCGRYRAALEKIAIEDETNSNFNRAEDESAYYIDIARKALNEKEKI